MDHRRVDGARDVRARLVEDGSNSSEERILAICGALSSAANEGNGGADAGASSGSVDAGASSGGANAACDAAVPFVDVANLPPSTYGRRAWDFCPPCLNVPATRLALQKHAHQ